VAVKRLPRTGRPPPGSDGDLRPVMGGALRFTESQCNGLVKRFGARARHELLEFVQLAERAKDKVEPLSGGMKRRLTIARALVNEPDIVLLDEPTTGLDPQARHLVWERLFRLKQRGVTLPARSRRHRASASHRRAPDGKILCK
jgi:ABC-type transport system involved in cytochrome bd biosynthesis fused ATPase/permease subunit